MAALCPLVVALIFGLLPELEAMKKPPIRGEITFSKERPDFTTMKLAVSDTQSHASLWSTDWLEEKLREADDLGQEPVEDEKSRDSASIISIW